MTSPPSDWKLFGIVGLIVGGFVVAWVRARFNLPVRSRPASVGGPGLMIGLLAGGLAASPWARNLNRDAVGLFVIVCGFAGWRIQTMIRKRQARDGE